MLFLATNAIGTWVTLQLGFPFYGFGYFAASLVAFVTASVVTLRCLDELPYHAFITGNSSVRR